MRCAIVVGVGVGCVAVVGALSGHAIGQCPINCKTISCLRGATTCYNLAEANGKCIYHNTSDGTGSKTAAGSDITFYYATCNDGGYCINDPKPGLGNACNQQGSPLTQGRKECCDASQEGCQGC